MENMEGNVCLFQYQMHNVCNKRKQRKKKANLKRANLHGQNRKYNLAAKGITKYWPHLSHRAKTKSLLDSKITNNNICYSK